MLQSSMLTLRKSSERGHFNHGWLDTYHTFSFAEYIDSKHKRFRTLRVINEDRVAPGQGFDTHSHNDMEIITFVIQGNLEHKDSMGNTSVIKPGEVQRMTAGTGVTHSEFNPSKTEAVHLLQIWVFPEQKNLTPGYEQKTFDFAAGKNRLTLIASRNGRENSVRVHQDVLIYNCRLEKARSLRHALALERGVWIQMVKGGCSVNGQKLAAGDGASVEGEKELLIAAASDSEFLLFDLA